MKKIAVLYGGVSSEREVSLNSGRAMIENLDKSKYQVIDFRIDQKEDIFKLDKDVDLALIGLHGKFGEDGSIQAVLDTMGIKYSGCNPLTSGVLMDKNFTKTIAKYNGILTAKWMIVRSVESIDYDRIDEIGYPVFIKPNSGGSSVATTKVKSRQGVEAAVKEALKYDDIVMIEEYIEGVEHTSFILNGEVFPTIRITSDNEFFDYEAKYSTSNGAKEEVVELDGDLAATLEKTSKICWDIYNCKGYVRADYIITEDNKIYLLEINTLPGMTVTSLIPKSAKAKGISYSELLDKLIETGEI